VKYFYLTIFSENIYTSKGTSYMPNTKRVPRGPWKRIKAGKQIPAFILFCCKARQYGLRMFRLGALTSVGA